MSPRRSEFITAAVWAVLGTVIAVASWRMDRLDQLAINPWSVPGLTSGLVGALMIALALALALRARRNIAAPDAAEATQAPETPAAPAPGEPAADVAPPAPDSVLRSLLAATLCVLFAGITLGRGLPFVIEASLFVWIFTAVFSLSAWRAQGRLWRGLAQSFAVAVLACSFIAWLFESVFLVRLP